MGKKILLADDSITIQKVIELTFSDEDFEVVTVGNGRLALERVQENPPDILLCDIIMPEKDGYEVCDFVKKDPALSHIPVLLLTGAFEPFDQERAARVGCDGFLAKPFEPQTLIAKVKDLLQRSEKPAAAPRPVPVVAMPPLPPVAPPTPAVPAPVAVEAPLPFEPAPLDEIDEPFFSPEPPPPRERAAQVEAAAPRARAPRPPGREPLRVRAPRACWPPAG
jgi:CheY-like chemotaxis protein